MMMMMLIVSFLLIGKNQHDQNRSMYLFLFRCSDLQYDNQREKEAKRQTDERIQSRIHYEK
jgi:hypothetical protein